MNISLNEEQITPERDRQSQRKHDRLNRLQMTSPGRRNRRHAARENQDRLPPPVPQPNFIPANLLQAGPAPQWLPPPNFPHDPLPVAQYPNLPRNAIAHVQHAHRSCIDYNARLNEQTNAAHNERRRQRNVRRQQDRDEIRQQAQDEPRIHPPQQPRIPDNEPALPAPPVYGPIQHEGPVGPQNVLHQPNHTQFIVWPQQEPINREAQFAMELRQQEAEQLIRQQQDVLRARQHVQEQRDRQNQDVQRAHHHLEERRDRQDQDIQRARQQAEEVHRRQEQRIREEVERLDEAQREYNANPASQEHHDDDEERRRI
ncbi:hypothetical protein CY34DRAFT_19410 [Suillus luteus UH-Slu-Lm8-n1]|uniref:Unplaced genomic scaffold CY34scaffold_1374, whole genome shotgun sequence n=1 Tax=Suillus luteus UH-Slu-Lm8-n1 TaxID=930992 RepID=A0A0C9ZRM8_9AGAM|nr:hypothetical protein CY34DRAFT_19410 [Suillus luteus UH-Slu-Lm8-n1]